MTLNISKRGLVRIISFAVAIVLVLSLLAVSFYRDSQRSRRSLEYRYMQSVADLTTYMQNIDSGLEKAMYAKTPAMLSSLSSKLWRESGFAKEALGALPVEYLSLQNTNKLLSQVGDYCVSLSKSFAQGNEITKEQRENMKKLKAYCEQMLSEVIAVNDGIQTGSISLASVEKNIDREMGQEAAAPTVAEGFSEFEEGFTAYPTLIYDGPFSDHIMEKEPEQLKDVSNVSRVEASKKAARITGIPENSFSDSGDEEGRMPSYGFSAIGVDVSITKQGGYLCYLLKSRFPDSRDIAVKDAITRAKEFMGGLNVPEMTPTYYEINQNVMTVNFACVEYGVVLYPDLIKIGVAMDNGEILSFDSRGFLTNHKTRESLKSAISADKARESVSELLSIEKSRLCIIPSEGLNESLCWEFQCTGEDEQQVLVYINAATGAEEQILILLIDENGQLTI